MMRGKAGLFVCVMAGALAGGCGSGDGDATSTTPSPPGFDAGALLSITDAQSNDAVSGASVHIGTRTYTSDASGNVALAEAVSFGTYTDVMREGFLSRQTVLRSDGRLISLWPTVTSEGVSEGLTHELIYDKGSHPLFRWNGAVQITLVPSAELAGDARSMDGLRAAADRITAATRGRMTVGVDPSATTGAIIRAVVDAARAPSGAAAQRELRGQDIVGGTLIFKNLVRSTGVPLHEFGHLVGFGHSGSTHDIMGPGPDDRMDFSAREKVYVDLMWQRRPGNAWPDNDRSVTTFGLRATQVIHCRVE